MKRKNALDFLRLPAAMAIVMHHIKMMYAFAIIMELFGAASYFLLEKRADRLLMVFLPQKAMKEQLS